MIPDYQVIMLPFLEYVKDGKERSLPETVEHISKLFKLSPEREETKTPKWNADNNR